MEVRVLGKSAAAEFKRLFREGLVEHPEAFAMGLDELDAQPLDTLEQAITTPDNRYYGAYDDADGQMVGIVSLQRYGREKLRHRALIGAMYVAPEARGQGIGRALLKQALHDAHAWDGVIDAVLAVTVGNEAARRLYADAGFVTYSTDPRLLKVDDRYYDIEWMICPLNG